MHSLFTSSFVVRQSVDTPVDFERASQMLSALAVSNLLPGLQACADSAIIERTFQEVLREEPGSVHNLITARPAYVFLIAADAPDVAAIIVGDFGIGFTGGHENKSFLVHETAPGFESRYRAEGEAAWRTWAPVNVSIDRAMYLTRPGQRAMCLLESVVRACQGAGPPRLTVKRYGPSITQREIDHAIAAVTDPSSSAAPSPSSSAAPSPSSSEPPSAAPKKRRFDYDCSPL